MSTNPVSQAEPPRAPSPDPHPPSAEEAARLVREAWRDPDWGTLVWLTMTTGARRGELCALRWEHVDLDAATVSVRRAIAQDGSDIWEKDTKSHQHRRVSLDPETVTVLTEHWDRCRARSATLGLTLGRDAFVFSLEPDGGKPRIPASVTQRFSRLAGRLGIKAHLHSLRHYSATELIAAGVDVRTVAGRLGHSGGGVTTLRVYAAWLAEADQRAAAGLLARMPARPEPVPDRLERAKTDPQSPRERLAVELRQRILAGEFPVGSYLPGIKQLALAHGVAVSTVHRAFVLLKEWGLIAGEAGHRAKVVTAVAPSTGHASGPPSEDEGVGGTAGRQEERRRLLELEIRHRGEVFRRLTAEADPRCAKDLHQLLAGALRRAGRDEADIEDYEMDLRDSGELISTFVVVQ